MEKDQEMKGGQDDYDFGARIYDSRVGRWLSVDPLVGKYPCISPYVFGINSPLTIIDPTGLEPTQVGATSVSCLIETVRANNIKSLEDLRGVFGTTQSGTNESSNSGAFKSQRYLYSKKWGWIDMKHFSAAAEATDTWYLTAGMVLDEMYEHEASNEDPTSTFDYEDLTSNLLGAYFETFLESEEAQNLEFADALQLYLTKLGFSESPLDDKPESNKLPETHHKQVDVVQHKKYEPKYTTEKRSEELDKKIIEFAEDKTGEVINE